MNEPTTWYRVNKSYFSDNPWEIIPIKVVAQTDKTIVVLESWLADRWRRAGSRTRRERFDGNQFDTLEAANAAVRDRLEQAYDRAAKKLKIADANLRNWEDVSL